MNSNIDIRMQSSTQLQQVVKKFWPDAASHRVWIFHGEKKLMWHWPVSWEQCTRLQQSCWCHYWFLAAYTTAVTHNAFQLAGPVQILPLRLGDLEPHLIHGSLAHLSHPPKRNLHKFNHFCIFYDRDQKNRKTQADHAALSVVICL